MSGERISVVVAVLNGARTLRGCLQSIINQEQPCELIVMDGGSTDETVAIIKEYDRNIEHWESAADGGLYHAWNKALGIAKADWICFLGADDYFSDSSSLRKFAEFNDPTGVNFVCGRVASVNAAGERVRIRGEPWNWERMKKFQVIAHPGALHHRSLFQTFGVFNTKYQIAADYEFLLRVGRAIIPRYVSEVTVCAGNQGQSMTRVKQVLEESRLIQAAQPEIGLYRANVNFLIAHSRRLARKFEKWLRYSSS